MIFGGCVCKLYELRTDLFDDSEIVIGTVGVEKELLEKRTVDLGTDDVGTDAVGTGAVGTGAVGTSDLWSCANWCVCKFWELLE